MNILKLIFVLLLILPTTAYAQDKQNKIDQILSEMSLSEKVGQMMFIGIYGSDSVEDDSLSVIESIHPGGIILFDRNMSTPQQVMNLTQQLQLIGNPTVPRFISVDEEGGAVARMRDYLEVPPSQKSLQTSSDANYWAVRISKNLRELGFNLNFSPVLDVSNNSRSFSANPSTAADFANSSADGYESQNFFYCLKHFPGIGKAVIDSHVELSTINTTLETLQNEDLIPFKTIINNHDNSKFMIMIGHYQYSSINPNEPGTLSKNMINDLLRIRLGFDGVVITDDMNMGAIGVELQTSQLGVRYIQAGGDMILICHEVADQLTIYNGIIDAVESGIISENRIDDSVRKILKMKLAGQLK